MGIEPHLGGRGARVKLAQVIESRPNRRDTQTGKRVGIRPAHSGGTCARAARRAVGPQPRTAAGGAVIRRAPQEADRFDAEPTLAAARAALERGPTLVDVPTLALAGARSKGDELGLRLQ